MKTPILGLRTVVYKVADLEVAKKWHTNAFEVEPYFDDAFYAGFNIGGYELGLLSEESMPKEKTESVFVYWGVNDVHKSFQKFIDSGAVLREEPISAGGDLMVASTKDPWRTLV